MQQTFPVLTLDRNDIFFYFKFDQKATDEEAKRVVAGISDDDFESLAIKIGRSMMDGATWEDALKARIEQMAELQWFQELLVAGQED